MIRTHAIAMHSTPRIQPRVYLGWLAGQKTTPKVTTGPIHQVLCFESRNHSKQTSSKRKGP